MSNSDGIIVEVHILSKTWEFKGFDAIKDLAEWLDENCSSSRTPEDSMALIDPVPEPVTTRANGV